MATKQKPMPYLSRFFIALFVLAVILGGSRLYQTQTQQKTTTVVPSITPETAQLANVAVWYPSAPWTTPKKSTDETFYGNLPGESMQATVTSPTASLPHFEIIDELTKSGFVPDNNLYADGPGSSMWGYKSEKDGKTQLLIFSYNTKPSKNSPNEPLQFSCPCTVDLNVFVSNPF